MTSLARHGITRFAASSALIAITTLLPACSTSAPEQTRMMRESADLDVSAEELRVRVRALVLPFSGIIEEAADAVAAVGPDPAYRLAALGIKTNAIPAVQATLLDPDPLVALLDTWALIAQMRLNLESERELAVPEGVLRALSRSLDRMEERITALVKSVARPGGYEHARDVVYQWAADNPHDMTKTTLTTRQSAVGDLAAYSTVAGPGLREAIGGLSMGMGDIWERLDVYSAFLPKQARWHAELMVEEMMAGSDPATALDDFSRLTDSIDRIAGTVEQAPGLVAEERAAILSALQAERVIALETLSEELTAAYEFISRERTAVFSEGLALERELLLEALREERIAAVETIRDERIATLEELDSIVGGLSEDALIRLVDRIFVRLALLIAVLAGIAFIGYFITRRAASQSGSDPTGG
jgi:hypothetical protein